MDHNIKIFQVFKNGHLLETINLKEGTYSIGRDSSSDIVLNDKAVSKTHAYLTIKDNSFIIKDNQSSNGIFHHGKKISEHISKDSFQIDIRPFSIRTANEPASEITTSDSGRPGLLYRLILSNIKISVSLFITCLLVLSLFIIYSPMKNQIESVSHQEHLKRGILLSKYLAEINRPFLESGDHGQIRTSPVTLEDGVIYAFVVDAHGRIIAPPDQQGNFFNWNELSQAFRDAQLRIGQGQDKEKIIFTPVLNQSKVAGAGIIGFRDGSSRPEQGLGVTVFFLLIILIVMSMIISYILVKTFLKPIRELNEEAELSIKEGRTSINFTTPYEELADLKTTLGRLLLRKTSDMLDAPEPVQTFKESPDTEKSVPDTPAGSLDNKKQESSTNQNMPDQTHPWCVVSNEDYTLKQTSENFSSKLGIRECKTGLHIIEAFDSELIQVVSQAMDDTETQALEVELAGIKYQVQREDSAENKKTTFIIFREASP